ncbi:MAG: RING-type domain-containing protein [Sporanaerobacter sp.]|jgi:hypothetical protein|uniref:hypothetical protein n=1 Tax=Sporanaerobacter sp. TaxID=2010183 RepID=UPI003A0FDC06
MAINFNIEDLKNLEKAEIEKLSNEDLTQIISYLNNRQIEKVGTMSLYDAILGYIDIKELLEENNIIENIQSESEKKLLMDNYKMLIKTVENIDEIKRKIDDTEYVRNLRISLNDLSNNLEPYIVEVSYVEEIVDYYLTKNLAEKEFKNESLDQGRLNKLIIDITSYVTEDIEDYYIFNEKISTIIEMLPFRITKERFFEIVESTLNRCLSNVSKTYIDYEIKSYKKAFNGAMESSYGIAYDDYFRRVQELKYEKLKEKDIDELSEISQKTKELYAEMEGLNFIIKNMGILTNKLMAVSLINSNIDNFEIDENILMIWKKYLKSDKSKSIELRKIIDKELSILQKDIFETNELLEKISYEAIDRPNLIDDKLNDELLLTKKILSYYNDLSFLSEDMLLYDEFDDIEIAEKNYLDEVLKNFTQYLNRNISTMTNLERKIRMRRLLSSMEFPFEKPEDFMDYIEISLDPRITSKEEILASMINLYYLMNMDELDEYED